MLTFLAAGRKSEVYLAWDARRRATVAVKLLRPGRPVSKLRKEAELLERLSHPVLVRGFGAALDGPLPHIVLEHVDGPSVRTLMRRGPVPFRVVAAVALQMATVQHYLAGEGLVHLDLKPQNILLAEPTPLHALQSGWLQRRAKKPGDEPPVARLIDVAGIKPVDSVIKALGRSVPELRGAGARAAPSAGVWLLGAAMWRMLTGGPEVAGAGEGAEQAPAGAERAAVDRSSLPRSAPEPLVEIAVACVSPKPAARPSAAEVAEALEPIVASSLAVTARAEPPSGRIRRRLLRAPRS